MTSAPSCHRLPPRAGVTLTELLVTVGVIAVLAGLTFTMFSTGQRFAQRIETEAEEAKTKVLANAAHTRPGDAKGGLAKKASAPVRGGHGGLAGKVPNEYLVTLNDSVPDHILEAERIAKATGGELLYVYRGVSRGFALRSKATPASLKEDPAVQFVEQSMYVQAYQEGPTGIRRVQAANNPKRLPYSLAFPPLAGVLGGGGGGRRNVRIGPPPAAFNYIPLGVCVMDTGVDLTHPDLNVVYSRGFGSAPADGSDGDGHGTHVAGTIGAKRNGTGVEGVFPGVPIFSIGVLGPKGGTTADVLAGLDELFFNRSRISVCNMSLGVAAVSPTINNAVDRCALAGIVMIVAAGNDSKDSAGYSPASASRAICVAAMGDTDGRQGGLGPKSSDGEADDTFAVFSNFGGVVKVIAPGVDITSTWPPTIPTTPGGKAGALYNTISGTSMAAPHVAGYCAIVSELGRLQSALGTPGIFNYMPQPLPRLTVPDEINGFLFTMSNETINGRFDKRGYPLLSGRP